MKFKLWLIEAEYKDVRNTYKDLMDYLEKTPDSDGDIKDIKDIKSKFKTKINTMIDNISNSELSYMYDNNLHALKNLEKLL
jgi:hypothetical protein